jgi:hypothetical protein
MKQNTLYSAVVNFINSYKLGETYTSEDFKNALREVTSGSCWAYGGQWYRVRTYQTYLRSAGFITNVKRGVWRINYHVPDWMSLYALETLKGYKDGYWIGREYLMRPDTFRNKLSARLKAYKQRIDKDGVDEQVSESQDTKLYAICTNTYPGYYIKGKEYEVLSVDKNGTVKKIINEEGRPWTLFTDSFAGGPYRRKAADKTMMCISNGSYSRPLTIGKEYKIIGEEDEYYNIIDDGGNEVSIFKWRFAKIKTPQQDTKKTWKEGDILSADLLNNYPHNFYGYYTNFGEYDESWKTRSQNNFLSDRKIEKIDIVDGRLAALISGTNNIWIEIATIDNMDNYTVDKVPQERLSEFLTELEALIAKYK